MSVRCHILTLLHLAALRTIRSDYWSGNNSKRFLTSSTHCHGVIVSVAFLRWGCEELSLLMSYETAGPVSLLAAGEAATLPGPSREPGACDRLSRAALPLVEIQTAGSGRLGSSGKRHVDGAASLALRYAGHVEDAGRSKDGHVTRTLRMMLEYKCAWYGRELVVVDRFFPSSKLCGNCGTVRGERPLNVREWTCDNCGTVHDRDVNAAKNIRAAGLAVSACGDGVRPQRESSRAGRSSVKQEPQRATAGIPRP